MYGIPQDELAQQQEESRQADEDYRWTQIQALSDIVARKDGAPTPTESALCGAVVRAKRTMEKLTALESMRDELVRALKLCQFDCRDKCPVCAAFNVSPVGETCNVHTKDCPVAAALANAGKEVA